ncbi:EthD family reductase [Actinoallomurus sp. CA-150999]|uniref:EthD family reductase n=1 Tax=Actinoallomurus sp. CA-150999 TaxID=3239887 RepID=UPI003D8AE9E6
MTPRTARQELKQMTATVDPAATQTARFVVLYDTPSDVEAFERHYNDVHIPLAKQFPGLRRYTRSHEPAAVIGEPCYMVVMLDWDDMAALEAALGSEIGRRTAEDAAANLARYTTFRAMILQLDEI